MDDAISSLETLADKLHDASDHERACATGAQFARKIAADLRSERDHYRSAYEGLAEAAENVLVAIGWGETLRLGYRGAGSDVEDFEAALDQLRAALPDPKEEE